MFNAALPTVSAASSAYFGQSEVHALQLHSRFNQLSFAKFQKDNENPAVNGSIAKEMSKLPAEEKGKFRKYSASRVNAGKFMSGDYAYKAKWTNPVPQHTLAKENIEFQTADESERYNLARSLMVAQAFGVHGASAEEAFSKAGVPGVTTALGINFYDLRPPVELLYPVNVPIRNSLPRISRVNDGWGTAAHWMATRVVGSSPVNAEEGKRVAYSVPDNNPYTATYKEIGVERAVTFTAQAAGEGFADNVGDEHIRALHSLFLGEEGMDLVGNSGTASGNNGYALGVAPTPTLTQTAGSTSFTGSSTVVYVYLVCISPMGFPNNNWYGYLAQPTLASGITPVFNCQNADGSTTTLNGGTSTISLVASQTTLVTGNNFIAQAIPAASTIPGVPGAAAYAWFVGTTSGIANALLYSITTVPQVTITAVGTGMPASSAGLSTDHSFNTTDYDGLLTLATAQGGYYASQQGQGPSASNSLTPMKMGGAVTEIETALQYFWQTYQAVPSHIWCGFQARQTLDFAMRWGGTAGQPFQVFLQPNATGGMHGGFTFDAYMSKWGTPTGNGNLLPIMHHPMLPTGTIWFDIETNPYPHDRIPYTRGMLVQRDYYSIEWPITTREWTFGTYAHQVIQHHVPWLTGQIANIGAFVAN